MGGTDCACPWSSRIQTSSWRNGAGRDRDSGDNLLAKRTPQRRLWGTNGVCVFTKKTQTQSFHLRILYMFCFVVPTQLVEERCDNAFTTYRTILTMQCVQFKDQAQWRGKEKNSSIPTGWWPMDDGRWLVGGRVRNIWKVRRENTIIQFNWVSRESRRWVGRGIESCSKALVEHSATLKGKERAKDKTETARVTGSRRKAHWKHC